ncbi:Acl4 protein [Starmerella bacillaris]|uniref:Acl4 protein n=1 Tax=Starmerella bacillaris TaxID=1247836 RepID=A0AAV5RM52_STABA|nr:Acl4 protein [Starmerella bacillaris]
MTVEAISYEELHADPEMYLGKLAHEVRISPNNVNVVQTLAEALLETGNAEKAVSHILHAIKLDSKGELGDAKFLWAGQIFGGRKGLQYFETGVNNLLNKLNQVAKTDTATAEVYKKLLCQAYLGMIEIWMTDLCMEPEAEQRCEQLISEAFLCRETDPEAWSVLGSIRISQIKPVEATNALEKSWTLFQQSLLSDEIVDYSIVSKLVRLAQNMLEMRMFQEVLQVCGEVYRLDDQVCDLYYLNCLSHAELIKISQSEEEVQAHIEAAQECLTLLEEVKDKEQEIVEAVQEIVKTLPVKSES